MPQTIGNIRIGTASWTDKTLIESGKFYPKDANTAEARLRYYAEHFPIVEVDSTYYYPPSEQAVDAWVNRSPDDFTFHIKAYSLLTKHPTRPNSLPKDLREESDKARKGKFVYASHLSDVVMDEVWRRFAATLMPLHSTGKLGVVHFQFPEWFLPGTQSRNYIVECQERLHNYKIAVEFRNSLWLDGKHLERTLSFLESHDIPLTCVDMPQGFRSSMPPIATATSKDLAYVRFHGRNTEEWDKPQEIATPRFAYKYTQEELQGWVPKLKELSSQTKEVHVLMNNCFQDYAVRNAQDLGDLLEDPT
ncbi:MAG TPA: DUF72 domain-containing protein [Actinomycetota bacterium]|nr:DUF72 domain-containing protein [Actinomycetota bacterium]